MKETVLSHFSDVILAEDTRDEIHSLAISTSNAKLNKAPYRHLLLYGEPGTGKTMVAKRLAISSGMDYAIMSGGDVGPLGKDAVMELNKLFQWANKSKKGLLLFIDEAEAFLSSRGGTVRNDNYDEVVNSSEDNKSDNIPNMKGNGQVNMNLSEISEERRNALNALLAQTGTQSSSFMLVLATNRPQDLDDAVMDRMDDAINFPLPSKEQRKDMLRLYYNSYIVNRGISINNCKDPQTQTIKNSRKNLITFKIDNQDAKIIDEIDQFFLSCASKLEGFSGREISKLVLAVLNGIYGRVDFTNPLGLEDLQSIFTNTINRKVKEHKAKDRMRIM